MSSLVLNVFWRLNYSVSAICLRARAKRRPREHSNANSQNTRCPNQNFRTFRNLCSTSRCTIVSRSERSHRWQTFSQSQRFARTVSQPSFAVIKFIPRKWKTFVASHSYTYRKPITKTRQKSSRKVSTKVFWRRQRLSESTTPRDETPRPRFKR